MLALVSPLVKRQVFCFKVLWNVQTRGRRRRLKFQPYLNKAAFGLTFAQLNGISGVNGGCARVLLFEKHVLQFA